MKRLSLLVVAALFSGLSFAQVDTEERDLNTRTSPTLNESKADADLKDKSSTEVETGTIMSSTTTNPDDAVSKDNSLCCGKEKDDGFLHKLWGGKDESEQTTKTKTKTKVESKDAKSKTKDVQKDVNKSEMELDKSDLDGSSREGVVAPAEMDTKGRSELDVNSDVDVGTGVATDCELNSELNLSGETDTNAVALPEDNSGISTEGDLRMDASGRSNLDLDAESDVDVNTGISTETEDLNLEMKDSGSRCPSDHHDAIDDDTNLEDSELNMRDSNSPKF